MRILAVALLCGVSVLGAAWFFSEVTRPALPTKVEITNNPTEAQYKALEARVDLLEQWAVKRGGRFK